jgi:acyl-CoA thioesterase-1
LRSRDSQSRRRRLLHRGLLGTDPARLNRSEQAPAQSTADDAIERATQAVLADTPMRREKPRDLEITDDGISTVNAIRRHAGLAAILALLRSKTPVTWLFTGDNIVQAAGSTAGWRGCVEIFAERIRGELRRAGDVVINTGVSGDSAPQLLATLKKRVMRFQPDVVAISLGVNDCKSGAVGREAFRSAVQEILERVRTAGAIPLVILPHPVYSPATRNRSDLRQYVEILRQVIVRDEVPCVDQWADWLQNWPDPQATRDRLSDGRIQLGSAGHQRLAGLIFQTLQIFDSQRAAGTGPAASSE